MNRNLHVETTILVDRDGEEVEVTLKGEVSPGVEGCYTGAPENCYPSEDPEVQDYSATVDGQPFELDADEKKDAEEALINKASEDSYCGPDGDDSDDYDY